MPLAPLVVRCGNLEADGWKGERLTFGLSPLFDE
jgi:hypothetical protein